MNNELDPSKGKNVRVRANAGEQWNGARGVVVRQLSPKLWAVKLDGYIGEVDFSTAELTVLN